MLICIPKDKLNVGNKMQKNVNINELLGDVQDFKDEITAFKNGYVPIITCVSLRSVYSNLVVAHECKGIERYYTTLFDVPNPLPFYGEDLLVFLSSLVVSQICDPSDPVAQNIMLNSKYHPIGVLYLDDKFSYPYFYVQILIHDDDVERMKSCFKDGYKFVPIKDMNTKGNLKKIVNEIFEIKEK